MGFAGDLTPPPDVLSYNQGGTNHTFRASKEICATCHEVDKGRYGISLEGAPAFQDVADDSAMTSLALRVFLRSPHEWMPDLMLSETETDDVIAYILSLK